MKLTNHDHIIEADWKQLCIALQKESTDYDGNIEDLFQAELYLISPVTEPARFLRKEYFLTSQQRDIERQILKKLRAEHTGYFWFSGLPGTGKSLLLYDIAMKLSVRQRVCMVHCGEAGEEWKILHERLQRIDFLSNGQISETIDLTVYSAILIDEAHLLSVNELDILLKAIRNNQPVIFSSDSESMISPEEMDGTVMKAMENLPGIQKFHLTDRIRTNAELSSFIQNIMHLPEKRGSRYYPNIEVVYANDEMEAGNLLQDYARRGYTYQDKITASASVNSAALRDTERMVTLLDERYYYDETGYLRTTEHKDGKMSDVRILFHQLNQAKERLAVIIKNNEAVYEEVLNLQQMYPKAIHIKKK